MKVMGWDFILTGYSVAYLSHIREFFNRERIKAVLCLFQADVGSLLSQRWRLRIPERSSCYDESSNLPSTTTFSVLQLGTIQIMLCLTGKHIHLHLCEWILFVLTDISQYVCFCSLWSYSLVHIYCNWRILIHANVSFLSVLKTKLLWCCYYTYKLICKLVLFLVTRHFHVFYFFRSIILLCFVDVTTAVRHGW